MNARKSRHCRRRAETFSSRGLWWWRGGTVEGLVTENFAPRDAEKHNFS
jgi:hypothetical protein